MRWFFVPVGSRYINRQVLGIFLAAPTILLSIALGDKLIQFLEKAAAGTFPQTACSTSCCCVCQSWYSLSYPLHSTSHC